MECSIEDCVGDLYAKHYCKRHYQRWYRGNGNIDFILKRDSQNLKFWSKVAVTSDHERCWLWTAGKNKQGYGVAYWKGKGCSAHVVAFMLAGGVIKPRQVVRHKFCRNPSCCNPKHLLVGTYKDNSQDAVLDGTWPHGESCGRSKLFESDVNAIRKLKGQITQVSLAKHFCVSAATIWAIQTRRSWKHI